MLRSTTLQRLRPAVFRVQRWNSTTTSAPKPSTTHSDIVVVGGGPAGLTIAAALKHYPETVNKSVTLVEFGSLDNLKTWGPDMERFENRVSSLTPSSVEYLTKIGVWEHVNRDRVQAYRHMTAWDGVSGSKVQFNTTQLMGEGRDIAYMTENFNLQNGLLKQLANKPNLTILDKTKVEGVERTPESHNKPLVKLSNGSTISTDLLIGADGANSPVRTFSGIEARGWDYNTHGLVATVRLANEQQSAWQRFLPTGPIALLPLPNRFGSLVWSTTPKMAAQLKQLTPEQFVMMVNCAFNLEPTDIEYLVEHPDEIMTDAPYRLSQRSSNPDVPCPIVAVQDKLRASFPLKMKHADTYIAENVALVGDAAHTTHPLAGQGLNMGQGDAQSLAIAIRNAAGRGADIGSTLTLEPYWADQYFKNHKLLGVVDKLHKLYSTRNPLVVGLRSLGLDAVNSVKPVKDFLMSQAS